MSITESKNNFDMLNCAELSCLLAINKKIFASIESMEKTLTIVADAAKSFLQAERSTVWLFEPEDTFQQYLRAHNFNSLPTKYRKIKVTHGIAGWVATNEKVTNVADAYQDSRFNPEVDQETGFTTRSILAVPIYSNSDPKSLSDVFHEELGAEETKTIGVLQLINKNSEAGIFTKQDESMAILFAEYTGIALSNCINYQKVRRARLRTSIAMDILAYHYGIEDSDIDELLQTRHSDEFKQLIPSFNEWQFSPYDLSIPHSRALILWTFEELGILDRFQIKIRKMARYILMVHHGYRPEVPYHNWKHAISVTHFAYLLTKFCPLQDYLTQLQIDMLLIATLTHDIDHRGTNNNFQTISDSTLAALYSSEGSILERHHLSQTMCLLNTPHCSILKNLPHKQYQEAIQLLQHYIIITDLANYFKCKCKLEKLPGKYNPKNVKHQKLLSGLLMTCSDLCQVTKSIDCAVAISKLVFEEFHDQGDKEKEYGRSPIAMMDREKSNLRNEQISFHQHVALPTFKILAGILPGTTHLYESVIKLYEHWQSLPENIIL